MDRYEAESIAERAADSACRKIESDIRFDYERAIRDLRNDVLAEIRAAIREHMNDAHREGA